jgi:hypothetical protein
MAGGGEAGANGTPRTVSGWDGWELCTHNLSACTLRFEKSWGGLLDKAAQSNRAAPPACTAQSQGQDQPDDEEEASRHRLD